MFPTGRLSLPHGLNKARASMALQEGGMSNTAEVLSVMELSADPAAARRLSAAQLVCPGRRLCARDLGRGPREGPHNLREASNHLARFGPNRLEASKGRPVMSSFHRLPGGRQIVVAKGGPSELLARCDYLIHKSTPLGDDRREAVRR